MYRVSFHLQYRVLGVLAFTLPVTGCFYSHLHHLVVLTFIIWLSSLTSSGCPHLHHLVVLTCIPVTWCPIIYTTCYRGDITLTYLHHLKRLSSFTYLFTGNPHLRTTPVYSINLLMGCTKESFFHLFHSFPGVFLHFYRTCIQYLLQSTVLLFAPPLHFTLEHRARICRRLRRPGIDSASLYSLEGRYVK